MKQYSLVARKYIPEWRKLQEENNKFRALYISYDGIKNKRQHRIKNKIRGADLKIIER